MNRNYDNENRTRKSAYDDFDEYGNPRTGNTNSLSRYTPQSRFGSYGRSTQQQGQESQRQNYNRFSGDRISNATRAYGDMSHGTRYGEGGSYEGGGSSYGHSNYGMRGNRGPDFSHQEGYWPESRRHGMGDYDKFINRNYGYFGRSSGGGYTNDDSSRRGQDRDRYGSSRREEDRDWNWQSSGYDRGYRGFGHTGYGSTNYNMRDQDRERSAYSNRGNRDERRDQGHERYYSGRDRFNPGMDY